MREQSPVRHQRPAPDRTRGAPSPDETPSDQSLSDQTPSDRTPSEPGLSPPASFDHVVGEAAASRGHRSSVPRRIVAVGVLSAVAVGVGRLVTAGRHASTAGQGAAGVPTPAGGVGASSSPASGAGAQTPLPSFLSPAPSGAGAPVPSPSGSPPPAGQELPRGGRQVFPRYRLVGYCGLPGSAALGRLGVGRLDDRVAEIEKLSRAYRGGRQALPVLELIAVVVQAFPGADGLYRERTADDVVAEHLAAARRHRGLLLLNVQPGRARFLDEVRAYERWLREPDVGVALDPEWAVGPGQRPGRVFGSTTGAVVDSVAAYLDGLVRAGDLPQKVLVVHQLTPQIVIGWSALRRRGGVVVVKSVDGIGSPGAKIETWTRLVREMPRTLHPGFKLFFDEDRRAGQGLMSPSEVLALRPQPEYVLYE
jgi:hypothetical protein